MIDVLSQLCLIGWWYSPLPSLSLISEPLSTGYITGECLKHSEASRPRVIISSRGSGVIRGRRSWSIMAFIETNATVVWVSLLSVTLETWCTQTRIIMKLLSTLKGLMVCKKVKLRRNMTHKNLLGCFAVDHQAASLSLTMHLQWCKSQRENNRLWNATECPPPKKNG